MVIHFFMKNNKLFSDALFPRIVFIVASLLPQNQWKKGFTQTQTQTQFNSSGRCTVETPFTPNGLLLPLSDGHNRLIMNRYQLKLVSGNTLFIFPLEPLTNY